MSQGLQTLAEASGEQGIPQLLCTEPWGFLLSLWLDLPSLTRAFPPELRACVQCADSHVQLGTSFCPVSPHDPHPLWLLPVQELG